jgi:hypothetical protein
MRIFRKLSSWEYSVYEYDKLFIYTITIKNSGQHLVIINTNKDVDGCIFIGLDPYIDMEKTLKRWISSGVIMLDEVSFYRCVTLDPLRTADYTYLMDNALYHMQSWLEFDRSEITPDNFQKDVSFEIKEVGNDESL